MTRQELASLIAKHEGKKVEVSIGNIREVLRILHEFLDEGVWSDDGSRQLFREMDVLKALLK